MKTYVYMCRKCGYDTATFELLRGCPNCRTRHKDLHLVGTSDDVDVEEKLTKFKSSVSMKSKKKQRIHA